MKKRKFVAIIIVMLLAITIMTGCGCSDEDRESKDIVKEEEAYGNFVVLSHDILPGPGYVEQYIMYDPQTKVMWTYIEGNDGGGLSIIYGADGTTPQIYEP